MSTRSERLRIPTRRGYELAGILDRPERDPHAWAIFAHCFTCSKDSLAAARVSRALARRGVGCLRLDFTGLGDSEGEFGAEGLTGNLDDLEAAADLLAERNGPARLLIGHSLGGAAALAAGGRIESVEAVVVIGAPSDPDHVTGLFEESVEEIERSGKATVNVGGRPFCVRKEFLDDLSRHDLLEDARELRKPLLVMHSPVDNVVGVEHAAEIFQAAFHPKSYVSLDDADHLLTRADDAAWVATVLAAWASRYVGAPEPDEAAEGDDGAVDADAALEHGHVRVFEAGDGRFTQRVMAGRHRLLADEPESVGGDDRGPSPYELLSAALGACTTMTLRMYADRKEWPLESVAVDLRHRKVHADDCEDCETEKGKLDEIEREIRIEGDLDETQRERLMEIADRCPVHRTLHAEVKVRSRLVGAPERGEE